MSRYILLRVGRGLITLIGISIAVFLLTHLFGDPVAAMLPEDASPELIMQTRQRLGLDGPLLVQFQHFVASALQGDFGRSLQINMSSRDMLLARLPATALLAAAAMGIAGIAGIALGTIAALRPRSWVDNVVSVISMTGVSMPEFWLALLLIVGLAIPFDFLPTSGYGSWNHIILPAIVLAVRPTGRIAQVTRSSMVDVLRQPYVKTAVAKGLPRSVILRRHVLKNSSITIVTMAGIEIADLISGAIVVETVFGWPGVGWLAGRALFAMDFPVVQTVVFWAALVTVTMNLLVDVSYAWLDPRIRQR
jgi:peptide/nickel transport system permease protein